MADELVFLNIETSRNDRLLQVYSGRGLTLFGASSFFDFMENESSLTENIDEYSKFEFNRYTRYYVEGFRQVVRQKAL